MFLKKQYAALDERLVSLEQRSHLKNIEIAGVRETTGEVCVDITVDLARAVGLGPCEGDV